MLTAVVSFLKFSRMIQVSDSNEVKCKKGWAAAHVNITAFSKFQTRCKNIECIGGNKKFVLMSYSYAPPAWRIPGKTPITFVPGTDLLAEHYLNSDEYRSFILDTFIDKSIRGQFYIYTRRGWDKDKNGRNTPHAHMKQVVIQWVYEEDAEEYLDPCTAGRRDGICECCGTVTCM